MQWLKGTFDLEYFECLEHYLQPCVFQCPTSDISSAKSLMECASILPPLMMVTVVETSDVIACTVVVLHFHIAQLRCGPCVLSNKGGDDDFCVQLPCWPSFK